MTENYNNQQPLFTQALEQSEVQPNSLDSTEELMAELFWKLPRAERRKLLKKNPNTNWSKYVNQQLFKPKKDE